MKLYNKIKNTIKRKMKKENKAWPSAYASGQLVQEYKRQGGKYIGKKPSKSKGLGRWYEEKWINVCKLPKKVSCGRPKTSLKDWTKDYPYCRPSKRINKSTPKTASELTKAEIKRRCKKKQKNPSKKVYSKRKK